MKQICGDCGKPYLKGHDCPEGRANWPELRKPAPAKTRARRTVTRPDAMPIAAEVRMSRGGKK
jgi:hypothetical protein